MFIVGTNNSWNYAYLGNSKSTNLLYQFVKDRKFYGFGKKSNIVYVLGKNMLVTKALNSVSKGAYAYV